MPKEFTGNLLHAANSMMEVRALREQSSLGKRGISNKKNEQSLMTI